MRRWTIQARLTVLYGGLFLVTGAVLLGITYVLAARFGSIDVPAPPGLGSLRLPVPQLSGEIGRQHAADLRDLLIASGIALAALTVVSVGLGGLVARRVLRPLRTMASTARDISEHNLHRRLALSGPADEITRLAGTFDGLLERLEAAFEAQRRFVANASHELRTPLTVVRSVLEVALADPGASVAELRAACGRVLANNQAQEELIEALLTLARSQRGLDRRVPIDLAAVVDAVLADARTAGCRIESELGSAPVCGDPALVQRLVANLVDNAVRYNVPDGWVRVWTGQRAGRPTLRVVNSGPVVAPEAAESIFLPFQRLAGGGTGSGLGLSIVDAIATAHGARLLAGPRADGGLDIEVGWAAVSSVPSSVGEV